MNKSRKFALLCIICLVSFTVLGVDDGLQPDATSNWKGIAGTLIVILGGALTALAGGLVNLLLALFAKKTNIQVTQATHDLADNAALVAVQKVEQWANSVKDTPTANDKLNQAIAVMKAILGSDAVKNFTNDQLIHFIEANVFKNNAATKPADPVVTAAKVP